MALCGLSIGNGRAAYRSAGGQVAVLVAGFKSIGVPFEDRGARADEYIDAMTQAWTGETVDFSGEFVNWHGFRMLPTPVQQPRVPIIVGGTSAPAIRRVVARGDGWYVIHRDLEHFQELMGKLRAECDRQGRDPKELEITAYWNYTREGLDGAAAYQEAGVDRLLVNTAALRMGKPFEASAFQRRVQCGAAKRARLGMQTGFGGRHRKAPQRGLPVGAISRLDQAEMQPTPGVCDRRLHRPAGHAFGLWCLAAGCV